MENTRPMNEPLLDMESRVLYVVIERGNASVSQLTSMVGSTTRLIEEAVEQLIEKGLLEEQEAGIYGATATGMGRWNEVVYLATEYP
jgi:hypothetical protein